jgi:hypothetical protein
LIGEKHADIDAVSIAIALQMESLNLLNNYSILKVTNVVIYSPHVSPTMMHGEKNQVVDHKEPLP